MKILSSAAIQVVQGNGFPMKHQRILPNDPCPCGSGKKAKRCCRTSTDFFYSQLNKSQLAELEAKRKAEQKESVLEAK
jgi:hypothetical protein